MDFPAAARVEPFVQSWVSVLHREEFAKYDLVDLICSEEHQQSLDTGNVQPILMLSLYSQLQFFSCVTKYNFATRC